jgi:toxin-antitoxin system PIN domain toxin
MRRSLLDVNVLLALLDSDHVDHSRATDWLDAEISAGWASCPITENGFVRVLSQPRYPSPVSPSAAIDLLGRRARAQSSSPY